MKSKPDHHEMMESQKRARAVAVRRHGDKTPRYRDFMIGWRMAWTKAQGGDGIVKFGTKRR